MNIKQLETFLAILDHGSFASAAQCLNTTQSTVSARVKDLEDYLGSPLFDRSGRSAKPTNLGDQILPFARHFVAYARSIEDRFRDPSVLHGSLRVGVVGVVANTWLPDFLKVVREFHPHLSLKLDMSLTRKLIENLQAGRLDLAIVAGHVVDPGLKTYSLGFDEFVWMVGPTFIVNKQLPVTPEDFQDWPILGLSEDSYHYPVVERWFRDKGVPHIASISSNNMNVIAMLTSLGLGVSLLPKGCYGQKLQNRELIELPAEPKLPPVAFSLVVRPDLSPTIVESFVRAAAKTANLLLPPVSN
jgi:DNA-binding transcriptional LysR family regulator